MCSYINVRVFVVCAWSFFIIFKHKKVYISREKLGQINYIYFIKKLVYENELSIKSFPPLGFRMFRKIKSSKINGNEGNFIINWTVKLLVQTRPMNIFENSQCVIDIILTNLFIVELYRILDGIQVKIVRKFYWFLCGLRCCKWQKVDKCPRLWLSLFHKRNAF